MPALILALALLAAIAFAIAWFLRANPSSLARATRIVLLGLGAFGAGTLLVFGARFLPGLLPELFGLAGIVITALIARAVRRRPSGGFSTPGAGQRTEVRTAFLQAWIDHGTGDVGGTIFSGRFAGRTPDVRSACELLDFHYECSIDLPAQRLPVPYRDRRLAAGVSLRPKYGRRGAGCCSRSAIQFSIALHRHAIRSALNWIGLGKLPARTIFPIVVRSNGRIVQSSFRAIRRSGNGSRTGLIGCSFAISESSVRARNRGCKSLHSNDRVHASASMCMERHGEAWSVMERRNFFSRT